MTYLSAGYYWVTAIGGSGRITVDGEEYQLQTSTGDFLIVVEQYASLDPSEVKFVKVPKTISIG